MKPILLVLFTLAFFMQSTSAFSKPQTRFQTKRQSPTNHSFVLPKLRLGANYFRLENKTHENLENILLGKKTQPILAILGTTFYVIFGIAAAVALTVVIGNIYAAISKKGQLEWGIAATGWFGLNSIVAVGLLISGIFNNNPLPTIAMSAASLVISMSFVGLGIYNILDQRKRKVRLMGFAPWIDYSRQTKTFSGGLSMLGSF